MADGNGTTGEGASGGVDRPLAGVRVVDVVAGPLAPASRYLAELGARVDRLVPPDAADALADRAANVGKRRHAFDHHAPEAAALLAAADLVMEDVGLDAAALRRARPAQVVLSVSPFGRGTGLSGWRASDAVLHALSGELSRSGVRGRAPLPPPGRLAWECAAAQAAFVAVQSLYHAVRTGAGDHLDFAALDGAVQALDPGFGIGGSATLGRPAHLLSRDRPSLGFQYPILPCADGHVRLCLLAPRQWQGMFRWMGEPPAFADPRFNRTAERYKSPDLLPAIAAFFAGRTRAELEIEAAAHGVPLSGLATLAEVPALPHFVARGAFRREAIAGREWSLPNGAMVVDGARMTPDVATEAASPATGRAALTRPFEGIKVLDLGVIVVGAETGRLLADQGADVVKVESRAFPDGNRQSYLPYGLSASFAAGHRNKRGLGLDLRHPDGRALFLELVAQADVVLSNFKPGTMESLGLGAAALAAANPRIVTVESSAFGDTGPWSRRMGYGPLVRAATGLADAWRYPGETDGYSDSVTIYPDHVAARIGAIAAVALLIRRERMGRGGHASIAQAEVMLAQFGPEIARAAASIAHAGEQSDVYRCAGDDEWCVVSLRDEADAATLAATCDGSPVAAWMAGRTADDAMRALQARGLAAARMLRVADLPAFSYHVERGLFRTEDHPCLPDPFIAEARQARSTRLAAPEQRPAPLMAEHGAAVLADWLGMGQADCAALEAQGVVERVDAAELAAIEATLHPVAQVRAT